MVLKRTEFDRFLLWEGVVILKGLLFNKFHRVHGIKMILKRPLVGDTVKTLLCIFIVQVS